MVDFIAGALAGIATMYVGYMLGHAMGRESVYRELRTKAEESFRVFIRERINDTAEEVTKDDTREWH